MPVYDNLLVTSLNNLVATNKFTKASLHMERVENTNDSEKPLSTVCVQEFANRDVDIGALHTLWSLMTNNFFAVKSAFLNNTFLDSQFAFNYFTKRHPDIDTSTIVYNRPVLFEFDKKYHYMGFYAKTVSGEFVLCKFKPVTISFRKFLKKGEFLRYFGTTVAPSAHLYFITGYMPETVAPQVGEYCAQNNITLYMSPFVVDP